MRYLLILLLSLHSCAANKHNKDHTKKQTSYLEPGTILIKGGTFEMGSNDGDNDEKPVHRVELNSFRMGQYEVTNAQFCQFLNEKGNRSNNGTEWIKLDGIWNSEKCRILKNENQFRDRKSVV